MLAGPRRRCASVRSIACMHGQHSFAPGNKPAEPEAQVLHRKT
jgi:hypothetical protein